MTDPIMDLLWGIHDRIGRAVVIHGGDYPGTDRRFGACQGRL
jgi:hypothetical protein